MSAQNLTQIREIGSYWHREATQSPEDPITLEKPRMLQVPQKTTDTGKSQKQLTGQDLMALSLHQTVFHFARGDFEAGCRMIGALKDFAFHPCEATELRLLKKVGKSG